MAVPNGPLTLLTTLKSPLIPFPVHVRVKTCSLRGPCYRDSSHSPFRNCTPGHWPNDWYTRLPPIHFKIQFSEAALGSVSLMLATLPFPVPTGPVTVPTVVLLSYCTVQFSVLVVVLVVTGDINPSPMPEKSGVEAVPGTTTQEAVHVSLLGSCTRGSVVTWSRFRYLKIWGRWRCRWRAGRSCRPWRRGVPDLRSRSTHSRSCPRRRARITPRHWSQRGRSTPPRCCCSSSGRRPRIGRDSPSRDTRSPHRRCCDCPGPHRWPCALSHRDRSRSGPVSGFGWIGSPYPTWRRSWWTCRPHHRWFPRKRYAGPDRG